MDAEKVLAIQKDIVRVLRNIYDPEIPVSVYELGLIYEVQVSDEGKVDIAMTLTAPTCPIADDIVRDVKEQVAQVPGVTDANVNLTFEPPWDKDMMSDEAKLQLGLL
ncbi:MAG: iron-sulfur cluster assembly protein [Prevotellaceae bacterium]|jgi:FeS assembly SUF system protein|nr:iron-sulfur cluster assembly protein [Prevotellaceae bacterium]MDR1342008.1 iron-sulfur cluster assembly protein [Prevotellaceae bacterium]